MKGEETDLNTNVVKVLINTFSTERRKLEVDRHLFFRKIAKQSNPFEVHLCNIDVCLNNVAEGDFGKDLSVKRVAEKLNTNRVSPNSIIC